MTNEMPKTQEEWFGSLGRVVKVYAKMENLEIKMIFQGVIASVRPEKKTYLLSNPEKSIGNVSFEMDGTEAFEFIT